MTPNATENQLKAVAQQFEELLKNCPPELSGRQKIIQERKNGHLFLTVMTSFRIEVPDADDHSRSRD
jgi:hypothetical protein